MTDIPPPRPGYNRDVPMTTQSGPEEPEEITTTLEITGVTLKLVIFASVLGLAALIPPIIWLWRWAL